MPLVIANKRFRPSLVGLFNLNTRNLLEFSELDDHSSPETRNEKGLTPEPSTASCSFWMNTLRCSVRNINGAERLMCRGKWTPSSDLKRLWIFCFREEAVCAEVFVCTLLRPFSNVSDSIRDGYPPIHQLHGLLKQADSNEQNVTYTRETHA